MAQKIPQLNRSQNTDTHSDSANNTYKFTTPAIVPDVVAEFRKNRHVIPLPRTVAMNQKIHSGAVLPALIHHLFERARLIEMNQQRIERTLERILPQGHGLRRVA